VAHLVQHYGLIILFLLVAAESSGIPLPGETALITSGVLASRGHFSIAAVIAVAAVAAIVGDNVGYWIGRKGGRRLIDRWEVTQRAGDRFLPPTERFFARHGGKTIFFARFIAVLRVAGAWAAGITRMRWWRFLFWNAAGGICWALLVGLLAYYVGEAAAHALERWGLIAGLVTVGLGGVFFLALHLLGKRVVREGGGD
jgi:membrane protein DedA with SNARE-associated domain